MKLTKKVRRSGGSLYITIPSDIVKAENIEEGDFVKINLEKRSD